MCFRGNVTGVAPDKEFMGAELSCTPECMVCCYCLVVMLCPTLVPPWAIARQAPLSMRFSRQEYWSGLPGDLPDPGI